jgi:hypothetical protein
MFFTLLQHLGFCLLLELLVYLSYAHSLPLNRPQCACECMVLLLTLLPLLLPFQGQEYCFIHSSYILSNFLKQFVLLIMLRSDEIQVVEDMLPISICQQEGSWLFSTLSNSLQSPVTHTHTHIHPFNSLLAIQNTLL